MSRGVIEKLEISDCRIKLSEMWNNVCDIAQHGQGLAMSMPILLADGWQVTLFAEEEMPGYVTLRDRGQMSSWLHTHGVNTEATPTQTLIQQSMAQFGVATDSRGFYKSIRLPMNAVEFQLFGCFLSSISHLTYRVQKQVSPRNVSYHSVVNTVKKLHLPFEERKAFHTAHRKLTVDITVEGLQRTALVQTFDQQGHHAVESMELWSSRLPEIVQTNPDEFITAMVYNEDSCNPTPEILSLAQARGNKVFPAHRRDEIEDYFSQTLAC